MFYHTCNVRLWYKYVLQICIDNSVFKTKEFQICIGCSDWLTLIVKFKFLHWYFDDSPQWWYVVDEINHGFRRCTNSFLKVYETFLSMHVHVLGRDWSMTNLCWWLVDGHTNRSRNYSIIYNSVESSLDYHIKIHPI